MGRFKYNAMTDKGVEVNGVVSADNQVAAIQQIRDLGYFPTHVVQEMERAARGAAAAKGEKKGGLNLELKFLTPQKVNSKVLSIFTRQLAVLIDAGLPLLKSLRVLEQQQKPGPLRDALIGMSVAVESGSTFSEALANYPKIFNKLFVNMVRAGEAGGVLEIVLNRLAEFVEKSQKLKSKVKSAMIYPVVVMTVAVGVLVFLMTFVVPKFSKIFLDFDQKLPALTLMLINVSSAFVNQWYIFIAAIIGIYILFRIIKSTEQGKMALDTAKLNLPVFGILARKGAVARFSRTLGTLITSGVPILQALNIVRETSGNEVISKAVGNVHDSIREGESIAGPLRETKVFLPMVISMIEVGEETGKLPEMLMKIADVYDNDVDNAVAGITSIIEPILIVGLAVIVGTIVIALFLPLITLIQGMSES
ncbi:MAG: type II secretion system F family protein [Verrucomicrobia bacterium]|nr:type II secretion system F family protein [Verrucomicrobiota bacterium]